MPPTMIAFMIMNITLSTIVIALFSLSYSSKWRDPYLGTIWPFLHENSGRGISQQAYSLH